MARHTFGGTSGDYVIRTSVGGAVTIVGGTVVNFYSAATSGTHYTDLLNNAGSGATTITAETDGSIKEFQGPDGITTMWADAGGAHRVKLVATDASATYATVIDHGSVASTARSTSPLPALWVGSVAPNNAVTDDLWWDTANAVQKRYNGTSWDQGGASLYEPMDQSRLTTGEATVSRMLATNTSLSMFGTQVMLLTYFTARKSETITQLRMVGGGTAAAATPTLVRAGIYSVDGSGNLTLAAAIANDTTLFASANTAYTRSLTSSFTKVAGQRYAYGLLVVSSVALPTMTGLFVGQSSEAGQAPRVAGQVTGQTDLPASVAVGSVGDNSRNIYAVCVP